MSRTFFNRDTPQACYNIDHRNRAAFFINAATKSQFTRSFQVSCRTRLRSYCQSFHSLPSCKISCQACSHAPSESIACSTDLPSTEIVSVEGLSIDRQRRCKPGGDNMKTTANLKQAPQALIMRASHLESTKERKVKPANESVYARIARTC